MPTLLIFGLAGLFAQFVNGALGMGFGVTATTALLAAGVTPAVASASIHLAQVGTGLVSGLSHWHFDNIDWRTVGILALPGGIGAFAGAYALSSVATGAATAWITVLLVVLGLYVLIRFSFLKLGKLITDKRPGARFLTPLGFIAGFVDASGGGGWGPIATSTLLSSGRLEPRKVVGSVSAAEFAVALAATVGFVFALTNSGMNYTIVLGLLIGGVIAAPIAAWVVQFLPPRVLGAVAGGLVVTANVGGLLDALGASVPVTIAVHVAAVALWIAGIIAAVQSVRTEKRLRMQLDAEPVRVDGAPASTTNHEIPGG